jgi:hypothetical protein
MATPWPWLALAALGALHGLNPVGGWAFAAARALRSGDRSQALRALLPVAAGHVVSVVLVAAAALAALRQGVALDDRWLLAGALAVLGVGLAAHRIAHRAAPIALWSFAVSTAHGAGLMLVPALVPLCLQGPAREITASGSWGLALAAVAVHMAAMLAACALAATGACHALTRLARRVGRAQRRLPALSNLRQ